MEDLDQRILTLLAADGRMSFTDLGKATGLSTSAVHQRVKRLEQRGLITGYGASIDYDQLGRPLTAFISIRPIDPSEPDDSPERLRAISEIESWAPGLPVFGQLTPFPSTPLYDRLEKAGLQSGCTGLD